MGRITIQTGIDNSKLDRGLQQMEANTRSAGATAGKNLSQLQSGLKKSSDEASKLGAEFEKLAQKKADLESRAILIGGESFLGPNAQAELAATVARMDEIAPRWEAAEQAAAQYQARIEEINATPLVEPAVSTAPASAADLVSTFKARASAVASFAKKAISSMGSITAKAGNAIKTVATKVSGFMRRTTKDTGGLTDAIGRTLNRIKQLLVSVLVFNVMRSAFKEFRDYVGAALNSNQQFVTSMGQLKAAATTAFQPILTYIVPAITTLVSWLATAMSYVARFVQMMSGQAAVTGKAGDSVAAMSKGMDDLAGSTKAAGDAAKRSRASFDLYQQLSGDGAAASGGGGGAAAPTVPVFEPVKIDTSWIDEFSEKLKSLSVDYEYFFELGENIGAKINQGLASIDWAWIQAWTVSTVTKIAALLNGAVAGTDWTLVGRTIAEAFNTILMGAYTWLTTFNWLKWGQSLGDLINGAIYNVRWGAIGDALAANVMKTIRTISGAVNRVDWVYLGAHLGLAINRFFNGVDWIEAGQVVTDGITGALSGISEAIKTVDWYQLGQDIRDLLVSIDWKQIIADLAYVIGLAIAGISLLLWGAIEDAVKSIGDFWAERFEYMGGNIIAGLFDGILIAVGNIATWLNDNFVKPFIDGFKTLFGIHSPSTVMAKLGINLIEGLIEGITSLMDSAIDLFWAIWEGVQLAWINSSKWFDTDVIKPIGDVFNLLKTTIGDALAAGWEAVTDTWQGAKQWFDSTVITPIRDLFSGMWEGIKSGINSFFIKIENGLNKMVDAINSVRIDIPTFTNPITGSVYGGGSVGFNIGRFDLPRLATGTVVPPNRPFGAILGDNTHEPEIVSPVSTMEQAVENVMSRNGYGATNVNVIAEGDDVGFIRYVKFRVEQEQVRQGAALSTRAVMP